MVNNGSVSAVRLRFQFGVACDSCLFQLLCFMFSLVLYAMVRPYMLDRNGYAFVFLATFRP